MELQVIWHKHECFHKQTNTFTNTTQISHSNPYDLTDYHWALKEQNKHVNSWVIRDHKGKVEETVEISKAVSEQEEDEIVMNKILYWDEKRNLTRQIDRT